MNLPFLGEITGWRYFSSGESQFLPNMRTISLHSQTNTHPQYHYSPVMEEQETHFSLVNMKSWMCHSVLSAIQCLASADVVYITHVYPPWHTRLSEIGGHHLHNVSSHLSTKTVNAYLAICILWDPLPLPQKIKWLRGFPETVAHPPSNTMKQQLFISFFSLFITQTHA